MQPHDPIPLIASAKRDASIASSAIEIDFNAEKNAYVLLLLRTLPGAVAAVAAQFDSFG